MYTIDKLPSQFNLGKQGETGVMSIQIDCSAWYALWPSGAPAVQFSTGGDPVLLSQASVENQILTIDVLLNMTAIAGSGTLLIRFIESGIEKRSVLVDTYVSASYALTNEPMPDPVVDWVNAATSKLGELDGRNIVAAEFVGDNLVFTKTNTDEVVIVGAKTTLKGDKGETGEIGPKGNAGNKGEIGNTGPQGQTGPQGTQGIKGNTGAKGDIGLTGPKGDKGDKGDQGARGAPSTIPGPRGYTGFRGEEGPRGSQGIMGIQGIQGIQGEQGYSAYEVWGQSNAGKTEAEYIAFLKQEALAAADIANASALAAQNNLLWRRLTTNPASFYPVPQSPLYVRASGEPIQEGTGDPAPSNIRPITPWLASGGAVNIVQTDGVTITLTAPQDIYGGWMDNEGRGEEQLVKMVFNGTEPFYTADTINDKKNFMLTETMIFKIPAISSEIPLSLKCSHYKSVSAAEIYSRIQGVALYSSSIRIYDAAFDEVGDLANFKAYLVSQYNAGTPVTLIGERKLNAVNLTIPPATLLSLPQADRTVPRLNVVATDAPTLRTDYAKSPIQESNEVAQAILNG